MKKIKENKGITLIALVITIIVMLILVGVTINVAINGGLIDTAREAAVQTQIQADKERMEVALISSYNAKTGELGEIELPEGFREIKVVRNDVEYVYYISENQNEFYIRDEKLEIFGDLNCDGKIDDQDYQLLKRIIKGTATPEEIPEEYEIYGDLDHDGAIKSTDLLFYKKYPLKNNN